MHGRWARPRNKQDRHWRSVGGGEEESVCVTVSVTKCLPGDLDPSRCVSILDTAGAQWCASEGAHAHECVHLCGKG